MYFRGLGALEFALGDRSDVSRLLILPFSRNKVPVNSKFTGTYSTTSI